jgi:threonine dehydratase
VTSDAHAGPEGRSGHRTVRLPTSADLAAARREVSAHLTPTPVVPTSLAESALLKVETAQPTGSFKVRGALAALAALPPGGTAVTVSAGNHGLGIAHAATRTGRSAVVVVPADASPTKVAKLRRYAVELVEYGHGYDEAETHALDLARAPDRVFVSPYNDPAVICGQATIGTELDAQAPGPLTVVCPVGGGGLAAGLALWARARGDVRLIGVEAAASRAVSAAVAAGERVPVDVTDTLADGLAGNLEPGSITPQLLAGTDFTAVTEPDLGAALRWLFTEHGLVAEGAGAAGVAAVLAGRVEIVGRLVVLLTGRNITPVQYAAALAG